MDISRRDLLDFINRAQVAAEQERQNLMVSAKFDPRHLRLVAAQRDPYTPNRRQRTLESCLRYGALQRRVIRLLEAYPHYTDDDVLDIVLGREGSPEQVAVIQELPLLRRIATTANQEWTDDDTSRRNYQTFCPDQ